jgi:hypothetical protein
MADYYSLLARKIGPLPDSTPQSRQAVYELARKALFNQLRAIQPPVAEQVIQTEGRSLDEAIARLETEAASKAKGAAGPAFAPQAPQEPKKEFKSESAPAAREQQRPAAPLPPPPEAPSGTRRVIGIVAVLVVLVGMVALAALHFRERPEDLAKLKPEGAASDSAERGKFSARAGGDDQSDGKPSVPVAQKAQLVIAAAQHPDKVEHAYNGAVIWRLENVGGNEGEPLKSAIRGDIDFPDAKTKVTLVIQKNLDATLSMSHTINISFKFGPGAELKGVKAIDVLRIRRSEAQSGDKLLGMQIPISENVFLIGLMRGDNEARNIALLRTPAVIDLPMQLSDGRLATINLEKGASGERVFADAIAAWSR